MDFTIDHGINATVRVHPLLVEILEGFSTWGVIAFGAAVVALWFLDPPRSSTAMRRACASGLAAAALALLANQVVIRLWQRPRPFEAHPGSIVPLIPASHDSSFPSDHAAAAFAIACAVALVAWHVGRVLVAWAVLIAVSRVLVGVHYPTDVLAGALVGLVAAVVVVRLGGRLVDALVRLVSRATDPLLERLAAFGVVRRTLRSATFREAAVAALGGLLLVRFAIALRGHLVDELPLAALGLWALLVFAAARGAAGRPVLRRRRPV